MPVQDDERERELVRMFNLDWDPSHQRAGVDALLKMEIGAKRYAFEVEVKSSTGPTVSTARDVGMEHIEKWRRKLFVVGFYSRRSGRPELLRCLCLTPVDMEPWIASIENKILPDHKIALLASRRLEISDLFEVCGEQVTYSVEDAKVLHKQQWSAQQYERARDVTVNGERRISRKNMLQILQLRSRYIAERGATLNNPHITKAHLGAFSGTDREISDTAWASRIRSIAKKFAKEYPEHPATTSSRS